MTISTGFLIYVALYRLTVLAVGALSIWLGFRLFNNAENKVNDSIGSASAEGNGFKLALTSILPGTYFALFGTVIIGIMLWKGEPQLDQQELKDITANGSKTIRTTGVRGSIKLEWQKLRDNPDITLKEATEPLYKIACSYQDENRIGEAVALARLAALYGKDEDKARYLDLLTDLLQANGDEEEAARTEQDAEAIRRRGQ